MLSNGSEAFVSVMFPRINDQRYTIIFLVSKESVLRGTSICHPKDQFCRKIGRQRALQNLSKKNKLVNVLNKKDMTIVANAILYGSPHIDTRQSIRSQILVLEQKIAKLQEKLLYNQ